MTLPLSQPVLLEEGGEEMTHHPSPHLSPLLTEPLEEKSSHPGAWVGGPMDFRVAACQGQLR